MDQWHNKKNCITTYKSWEAMCKYSQRICFNSLKIQLKCAYKVYIIRWYHVQFCIFIWILGKNTSSSKYPFSAYVKAVASNIITLSVHLSDKKKTVILFTEELSESEIWLLCKYDSPYIYGIAWLGSCEFVFYSGCITQIYSLEIEVSAMHKVILNGQKLKTNLQHKKTL